MLPCAPTIVERRTGAAAVFAELNASPPRKKKGLETGAVHERKKETTKHEIL